MAGEGCPLAEMDASYVEWLADNRARVKAWEKAVHPLAGEMHENGVAVVSAVSLVDPDVLQRASDECLDIASDSAGAVERKKLKKDWKKFFVEISINRRRKSCLRLALEPRLLEAVAGYYRMWPRLHQIALHINSPTSEPVPRATQLWHRDDGDLKVVKVFVYLVDVDETNGPFCYIPKTQALGALAQVWPDQLPDQGVMTLYERETRATDEEMSVSVPPALWKTCVGPKHTMILADTTGYHRGLKPVSGTRIMLSLTYSSGSRKSECAGDVPEWATDEGQRWAML